MTSAVGSDGSTRGARTRRRRQRHRRTVAGVLEGVEDTPDRGGDEGRRENQAEDRRPDTKREMILVHGSTFLARGVNRSGLLASVPKVRTRVQHERKTRSVAVNGPVAPGRPCPSGRERRRPAELSPDATQDFFELFSASDKRSPRSSRETPTASATTSR